GELCDLITGDLQGDPALAGQRDRLGKSIPQIIHFDVPPSFERLEFPDRPPAQPREPQQRQRRQANQAIGSPAARQRRQVRNRQLTAQPSGQQLTVNRDRQQRQQQAAEQQQFDNPF